MSGLFSSIFGASTSSGLAAQQQQAAQQAAQQANQSALAQLAQNVLLTGTSTFSTSGTFTTNTTNGGIMGQSLGIYPGQVINTQSPNVQWPSTTTVYPAPDTFLAEELKALKELVYSMRLKIAKLEGEIIRLHSTGEGKDAAADDILRQMDCYTSA